MKMVLKLVGTLLSLLVVVIAVEIVASESGEVVVLRTENKQGHIEETRLWVVDHNSAAWLRSGSPASGWYKRLQATPQVQVVRNGEQFTALAEPRVGARDEINAKMADKYGWADSYIGMLFGRDDAVPVRLNLSP